MTNKKLFLVSALFIALLTSGCGNNSDDNPVAATTTTGTNTGTTTGTTTGTSTNIPSTDYSSYLENTSSWANNSGSSASLSNVTTVPYAFTADDTNTNYDSSTAITYNFDALSSYRASTSFENGILTIDEAGTYILKGTLNGHICIPSKISEGVTLVLSDVTINGQTHSAIYSAKKTPLSIIIEGTNTLNDASSYTYADDDEPSACLFSKGDLTIKGNGTLNVNANCAVTDKESDGIQSKGDNGIVITGGNINITTKGTDGGKALKSKNNIAIKDGNLTLNAPDGCIKAKGFVYINGGTFNLTSTNSDLIKVENDWEDDSEVTPDGDFYMDGGTITGTAYGDGIQATDELFITGGNVNVTTTNSTFYVTDANGDDESSKGIKSGCDNASGTITIAGGNINLNTQDHAIKCKGPINIKGNPSISITASLKYRANGSTEQEGGKGITGEGNVTIGESGNPVIRIYDAEEGIESKTKLTIAGGDIKVKTWDDGLNVGGTGTDLNITGGSTYIYANGDGIDSNKNITMTGGTLVVNSDSSNDNSAVDLDGTLTYSGGTLVAAGPSGMDNSKQNSGSGVCLTLNGSFTKGQLINIQDTTGNEVLTFIPAQNCTSVKIGSSSLISGKTYNVYQGGSTTSSNASNGIFTGGKYTAGTLLGSVTISSSNATLGTSGGPMGGQPGQPGGQSGQMGEPPNGQPGQMGGNPPNQ